jgi:hypothetical protein
MNKLRAAGSAKSSTPRLARVDDLSQTTGERHDESNMAAIDR